MKAAGLALASLVLLALATLVLAPATLLDHWLAGATSGTLRLADAQGRAWRGTGTLIDARGGFAQPLAWRADLASLLRGGVALSVAPVGTAASGPSGVLAWRAGEASVRALSATLPAGWLPAVASARDWSLAGTIRFDGLDLSAGPSALAGRGEVRWQDARVQLPGGPSVALGEVILTLAQRGPEVAGTLANRGGQVAIGGELRASPTATTLDLTLAASPDADPAVARALAALSAGDASGPARVRWQGPALSAMIAR